MRKNELKLLKEMIVDSKDLVEWYESMTHKHRGHNSMTSGSWCNCLYLIHDPGTTIYKIGITSELKRRLDNLITGSGRPNLYIVDQLEITTRNFESPKWCEQLIHKFFEDKRIVGEWFSFDKRDIVQLMRFRDFIKKKHAKAVKKETRKAYLDKKSKRNVKPPPSEVPYERPGIQISQFLQLSLEKKRAIMEKISNDLKARTL